MRRSTERAAWSALGGFLLFLAACVPFLWPIMFLPHSTGWPTAWVVQLGWGVVLIVVVASSYNHNQKKRKAQRQAQLANEYQLMQYRTQMARTGQPWFDAAAGHYRHGTCTIKHRSEGAARRCSSTI